MNMFFYNIILFIGIVEFINILLCFLKMYVLWVLVDEIKGYGLSGNMMSRIIDILGLDGIIEVLIFFLNIFFGWCECYIDMV